MKNIIFIVLFLIVPVSNAGPLSVGFMGNAYVKANRDVVFSSIGELMFGLDFGRNIVIGVDIGLPGSRYARIGKSFNKDNMISVGVGMSSGYVSGERVGDVSYHSQAMSLNITFIEYKRGNFFTRIGRRTGSAIQTGMSWSGGTQVYSTRERTADDTFISIGGRIRIGK